MKNMASIERVYDTHTIYFLSREINPSTEQEIVLTPEQLKGMINNFSTGSIVVINMLRQYDRDTKGYNSKGLGYIYADTDTYNKLINTHLEDSTHRVTFLPARVDSDTGNKKKHILYCRNIPNDFTKDHAVKIFSGLVPYGSPGPDITIHKKSMWVTFPAESHDAEFALLMVKKVQVPVGKNEYTLTFTLGMDDF